MENFGEPKAPKEYFRGTKIKCWYIYGDIYLFNPKFYVIYSP